ncbi:hypothetical protein FHT36_000729 [Xanthobacter sp. SG618]|uniref:hypothetical protein n=1 Tax=Xanthobacter sp. SG618 TaxID=2587121 RepID=UPI0017AF6E3D|nr:hypothetical protein [Xanthobacter sp. SG618]
MFANFEASLVATLAPATSDKDEKAWRSILKAYDHLVASPFAEAIITDDRIQILLEEGYLSTEASLRRGSRDDNEKAAKGSARRGKPEAPPPPLIVPELPPPTRVFSVPSSGTKAKVARAAAPRTVPAPTFAADGTFFVRTLTSNDVAKAIGAQVGTFEPDLGTMARDQLPEFWGWPSEFRTVVHTKPRDEWAARAVVFSTAKPAGVEIELMIWFREARPKTEDDPRQHAAEFRFRPGPKATFQSALPAHFSVTSLVVIERLAKEEAYDFRLRIITQGEPEYDDYHRYLTTTRPGHRFGYGPDDPEE